MPNSLETVTNRVAHETMLVFVAVVGPLVKDLSMEKMASFVLGMTILSWNEGEVGYQRTRLLPWYVNSLIVTGLQETLENSYAVMLSPILVLPEVLARLTVVGVGSVGVVMIVVS